MRIKQQRRSFSAETLEQRLLLTANELVPYSYAWVSQAGPELTKLDNGFAYNGTGGDILVQQTAVGKYRVEFESLEAAGQDGGNVQVTAYGGSGHYCNTESWGVGKEAADFSTRIACFDNSGAAVDSAFSVAVLHPETVKPFPGSTINEGQLRYAWVSDSDAESFVANEYYTANDGDDVLVTRTVTGQYRVNFQGLGTDVGGTVQVSGYGSNNIHCSVGSWSDTGGDFVANVQCTDPDGSAANGAFSIAVIPAEANSSVAYAWASRASVVDSYVPNETYSHNPEGGDINIVRRSQGLYRVTFGDAALSPRTGGNVQVTSYGNPAVHCNVTSWSSSAPDLVANVGCFNSSGTETDSLFTVLALASPDGDRFEPNDTLALATDLGTGSQTLSDLSVIACGTRDFCSVPDYYGWTADATGKLTIGVDPADVGGILDFHLYDAGGTLLASAAADKDPASIEWGVTEDSLYFIRVFGQFGRKNDSYELTLGSTPSRRGDVNLDGEIDAADIDKIFAIVRRETYATELADLNGDTLINAHDTDILIEEVLDTVRGDVDLNGKVDFADFLVLSTSFSGEGGWLQADFDGDGRVGFPDFLLLSLNFGFERTPYVVPLEPSGIEVKLNSLFYSDGDEITVTLDLNGITPPTEVPEIVLSSEETGDVENISLRQVSPGRYISEAPINLALFEGESTPADGVFTPAPDANFYAMFLPAAYGLEGVEEDLIFDFGIFGDDSLEVDSVLLDATLTSKADALEGLIGTLGSKFGVVEVATEEVLLFTSDRSELDEFLARSGGELRETQSYDDGGPEIHRIAIVLEPLTDAELGELELLRDMFGEEGELVGSSRAALSIYHFVLSMRAEGFAVSVNPRLDYAEAPQPTTEEQLAINNTMDPQPIGCNLDEAVSCVTDISAVWAHNALWDFDRQRIPVAVLDMGFATNDDFRAPVDGPMIECDMTLSAREDRCFPGAAQGPPTVGNSLFGDRSWHGTGVVTALGGVLNNGFGAAGVGGQNVEPMLYKYDLSSYAFDIGAGIRQAVDDGAAAINISAGYPCRILTNVGPDFDICSPGGRAGIAALVNVGAFTAAATICAAAPAIPFFGSIACAIANSVAATAVAGTVSTLAFGELRGPMERAVRYATNHGVPVVASAGNNINLPDSISGLVDTSSVLLEDWLVVPASIPGVIAVGSVNSNFDSRHFNGDLVDTWAPTNTAFFAPSDVDDPTSELRRDSIGATSGAAPWVTGLIAVMQAINPELNPLNYDPYDFGDSLHLRRIVPRITQLITSDENSTSNAELVAMGGLNQPVRREIVNPLKVVEAAVAGLKPNLAGLGYDETLGFSELLDPNDTLSEADPLSFDVITTGTIVDLRPVGPVSATKDVDWFSFTMPTEDLGVGAYRTSVSIQHPSADASIQIVDGGDEFVLTSRGSVTTYAVLAEPGETLNFALGAAGDGDNVYKVTVETPTFVKPILEIVNPLPGQLLCAGDAMQFEVEAHYEFPFADRTVDTGGIDWLIFGRGFIGSGFSFTSTLDAGVKTIRARATDDLAIFAKFIANVQTCASSPAAVSILRPDNGDRAFATFQDPANGLGYRLINLLGRAEDPEDGLLPDRLLTWTTNRDDVQPAELGSGNNLNVRLYAAAGQSSTVHRIRLTVIDSDGVEAFDEIEVLVQTLI